MIKCINCGYAAAVVTGNGLACSKCGHEWTFGQEAESAAYIKTVLRRTPIIGTAAAVGTEVRVAVKDDLKIIDGIGAKTQTRLNEAGFSTFWAMANTTPDQLLEIIPNITEETALDWISRAGQLAVSVSPALAPIDPAEKEE